MDSGKLFLPENDFKTCFAKRLMSTDPKKDVKLTPKTLSNHLDQMTKQTTKIFLDVP